VRYNILKTQQTILIRRAFYILLMVEMGKSWELELNLGPNE